MYRLRIIAVLTVLAVILAALTLKKRRAPEPPDCLKCNFILISADSVRLDRMSVYGYGRDTTPNLKARAGKAWVFENYFSTAYLTPISEASVHTGLYPELNGLVSYRNGIDENVDTLAKIFKKNGYATAAFGDSAEFAAGAFPPVHKSFSAGFDRFDMRADRLADRSLPMENIRSFIESARKPFFLWLTIGSVHAPFGANIPNKFMQRTFASPLDKVRFHANMQYYYDGFLYNPDEPGKRFFIKKYSNALSPLHKVESDAGKYRWPVKVPPEDLSTLGDLYDNGILHADAEMEKLLSFLDQAGLSRNTVVVIQSEHGETLGERGYVAHYDITDEIVHVPLLVFSPRIAKGLRVPDMVSGVDILPSIGQHLKLDFMPRAISGKSFFSSESGTLLPKKTRDEAFFTRMPLWESMLLVDKKNSPFDRLQALDAKYRFKDYGVRSKDHKVIHRLARKAEEEFSAWTFISGTKIHRNEFEFYDLKKDPQEKNPADSPDVAQSALLKKLFDFEKDMKANSVFTPKDKTIRYYR